MQEMSGKFPRPRGRTRPLEVTQNMQRERRNSGGDFIHAFITHAATTTVIFLARRAASSFCQKSECLRVRSVANRGVARSLALSPFLLSLPLSPTCKAATWRSTCGICTCPPPSVRPPGHARTPSTIHSSFLIKFGTKAVHAWPWHAREGGRAEARAPLPSLPISLGAHRHRLIIVHKGSGRKRQLTYPRLYEYDIKMTASSSSVV